MIYHRTPITRNYRKFEIKLAQLKTNTYICNINKYKKNETKEKHIRRN